MSACDPKTLISQSKCFQCYDQKESMAVQTYLLAVIAGASTDPKTLQQQAKAFQGLSYERLLEVQAYLLCQISGG